MGLLDWLFGKNKKEAPPPRNSEPSPTEEATSSGLLAQMFVGPLLASVKASSANLADGEFFVDIVETYFQATAAVKNLSLFGTPDGPRKLAVMAHERAGGILEFRGEDAGGQAVDLEIIREPAILYVPRQTLGHLKQRPSLWKRVMNPDAETSSDNARLAGMAPATNTEAASPPPPAPLQVEPAAEASPFGDAADAEEIFKTITKQCCEHDDGSGDIRFARLRTLLKGLKGFHVAAPLAASDLRSLGKLLNLIRRITTRLRDKEEKPVKGLDELRSAAMQAARCLLAQGTDAICLCEILSAACCEHDDASGGIYATRARILFEGVQSEPLIPSLSESKIRDLNNLRRLLDCVAEDLGHPRCQGLGQVRSAVDQVLQPALQSVAECLPSVEDAEQMCKELVNSCCIYDDGSGHVYLWAVRIIFDPFDVEKVRSALAASGLKPLTKLYSVLRRIVEQLDKPCKGLEQLRLTVLDSLRGNMHQVQNRDELAGVITTVACKYSIGSEIFTRETRLLLQDLDPELLSEALTESKRIDLDDLGRLFSRVSEGLGHPQIPALETLRTMVEQAKRPHDKGP